MHSLLRNVLVVFILCAFGLAALAQDIERPAGFATGSLTVSGCSGTYNAGSGTNTGQMYDGGHTLPAPNSTSGTYYVSSLNYPGSVRWAGFNFQWSGGAQSYSSLTLSINLSCTSLYPGDSTAFCAGSYSTNSGSTFASLYSLSDTAGPQTVTVTIPASTALGSIVVNNCVNASYDTLNSGLNQATVTIWDVWLYGTYLGTGKQIQTFSTRLYPRRVHITRRLEIG